MDEYEEQEPVARQVIGLRGAPTTITLPIGNHFKSTLTDLWSQQQNSVSLIKIVHSSAEKTYFVSR